MRTDPQPINAMSNPITSTDHLDPEAGFTSTPSVTQAANDLRSAATDKAKELIHTAEAKASQFRQIATEKASAFKVAASEQASHLKENATEQWDHTRVRAREVHATTEDYIREHPTRCVLGALGIGFLAGLIMRR